MGQLRLFTAFLLFVSWCLIAAATVTLPSDNFDDVKSAVKKLNVPYYLTEATLDEGKGKSNILVVFVDAPVAEWQVSYHKGHVLVLLRPSLTRSMAFERWATYK